MAKLIALRGYPASGKSTWAREWLSQDPKKRLVTSRDDLRKTLFNEEGVLSNDKELFISKVQKDIVIKALTDGLDVVVDNTHLRARYLREWADVAADFDADFEIKDFKTDPMQCIGRDYARGTLGQRSVGADVINNIAKRFPTKNWKPVTARPKERLNIEPYEIEEGLPYVVICDIDGTIADFTGLRGPFDLAKVSGDLPKEEIIKIVNLLSDEYGVIYFSGREDVCFDDTLSWLNKHVDFVQSRHLHMRKAGDGRQDAIVKYEMFQEHIRGKYNVAAVIDDRLQVVRMWHKLGVPVFRVGDPDAIF